MPRLTATTTTDMTIKTLQSSYLAVRRQANQTVSILAKILCHAEPYQPLHPVRSSSPYDQLARFYPFSPPIAEQRAWLERQYQQ